MDSLLTVVAYAKGQSAVAGNIYVFLNRRRTPRTRVKAGVSTIAHAKFSFAVANPSELSIMRMHVQRVFVMSGHVRGSPGLRADVVLA